MNPWQFLRREIGGTVRSLRYDMAAGRARRRMTQETMELPVIAPGAMFTRKRRRVVLAAGTALVAAAGVSGYFAVSTGLDALVGGGGGPGALPGTSTKPKSPSPNVSPATSTVPVGAQVDGGSPPKKPVVPVSATPTLTPPVPTPAPTCNCPTPSPTPSASTTPSPSPSGSPSSSPSASSSATMMP